VVAPLQPRSGGVSPAHARFSLNVSPFLDGRTGVDAGLSNVPRGGHSTQRSLWRELGAFVRQLHVTVLPASVAVLLGRETYRPAEMDVVRRIDTKLAECTFSTEPARELGTCWQTQRDTILALADRAEALGSLSDSARRGRTA
jgi:hypothetical protein